MTLVITESPLDWPAGLRRTETPQQGAFASTFSQSYDEVCAEVRRMGVAQARLTATMLLRNDGLPYADQRSTDGVALYFKRSGTEFVVAIDRYRTTTANMRAVAHILAAYRTIERHGGRRLALQALEGFRALTPGKILALPATAWWRVLGFPEVPQNLATALKAYRQMLSAGGHPDHGLGRKRRGKQTAADADIPEEFRAAAEAIAEARKHFATEKT